MCQAQELLWALGLLTRYPKTLLSALEKNHLGVSYPKTECGQGRASYSFTFGRTVQAILPSYTLII
jgi:hypothetical protein